MTTASSLVPCSWPEVAQRAPSDSPRNQLRLDLASIACSGSHWQMSNTAVCRTARHEYFVSCWANASNSSSSHPTGSLAGAAAKRTHLSQHESALIRLICATSHQSSANSSEQSNEPLLRGLAAAAFSVPRPLDTAPTFRYWIDYQAFSSPESAALPEAALMALGGVKTGGPPKLDPITAVKQKIKDYGYMHMDKWELLLSITAKAMLAAEVLRPYQMVSIVPGCLCISRKTSLVRTLINTYGHEVAFTVVPRTFKLPEELDSWDQWVRTHPQQDTGLWMLKNNKQRGTGLRLVPTQRAFEACFETTTRPGLEGMTLYRWYLAQQYITQPLLINRRKFGIRVWVTVPGVSPLRVYMHRNGLALFSSDPYKPADFVDGTFGSGHITNYAQNENGDVWSLQHLARHMGHSAWKGIWFQLARVTALVFAAALRRIQEVQAQMDLHPRQTFQYFGLDFLLDSNCHPWLMEVNATPSMKVAHEEAHTEQLIQQQKWEFVQDTFQLLGIQQHMFDEVRV
eukprot:GHUV01022547.1.p1 GENE.GHUV01022547.1~~GHUV01022547.1.p1  ORF type:complete len:513 (+),score=138.38 GHUV01022547.1:1-1539(+)